MGDKKKKLGGTPAPIMRKAKVHTNEDLKAYDRKRTKEEEREAERETGRTAPPSSADANSSDGAF